MTQSICVACLGAGLLFDNKPIDEFEQERNPNYWSTKSSIQLDRLW